MLIAIINIYFQLAKDCDRYTCNFTLEDYNLTFGKSC